MPQHQCHRPRHQCHRPHIFWHIIVYTIQFLHAQFRILIESGMNAGMNAASTGHVLITTKCRNVQTVDCVLLNDCGHVDQVATTTAHRRKWFQVMYCMSWEAHENDHTIFPESLRLLLVTTSCMQAPSDRLLASCMTADSVAFKLSRWSCPGSSCSSGPSFSAVL